MLRSHQCYIWSWKWEAFEVMFQGPEKSWVSSLESWVLSLQSRFSQIKRHRGSKNRNQKGWWPKGRFVQRNFFWEMTHVSSFLQNRIPKLQAKESFALNVISRLQCQILFEAVVTKEICSSILPCRYCVVSSRVALKFWQPKQWVSFPELSVSNRKTMDVSFKAFMHYFAQLTCATLLQNLAYLMRSAHCEAYVSCQFSMLVESWIGDAEFCNNVASTLFCIQCISYDSLIVSSNFNDSSCFLKVDMTYTRPISCSRGGLILTSFVEIHVTITFFQ